jgi:hypothetical protein
MMRKPKLFIASSAESINVANAVNVNLDHNLEVTLWNTGTFKLSSTTVEDLVKMSSKVDFALFVFTPDDLGTIRDKTEHIVRDNVLFELGLFIGAIGKERSFILKPRGEDMHFPTDLLGTCLADYEPNRSDGDIISATNRACSLILNEIRRIGLLDRIPESQTRRLIANPVKFDLDDMDYRTLIALLASQVTYTDGILYGHIAAEINKYYSISESAVRLSIVKLVRMMLVDKIVSEDSNGCGCYRFKINESGLDRLLSNEAAMKELRMQHVELPF